MTDEVVQAAKSSAINWSRTLKRNKRVNFINSGGVKSKCMAVNGFPVLDYSDDSLTSLNQMFKGLILNKQIDVSKLATDSLKNKVMQLAATDRLAHELIGMSDKEQKTLLKLRKNYKNQIKTQSLMGVDEIKVAAKHITKSCNTFDTFIDKITDFILDTDNINQLIRNAMVATTDSMIKKTESLISDIRQNVTICASICFNILRFITNRIQLSDLIVNCLSFLSLVQIKKNILQDAVKKIKSFFKPIQTQFNFDDLDKFKSLGKLSLTVLFLVFAKCLPNDKTIDMFVRRLDSLPKAMTGIEKFWNLTERLFSKGSELIEEHILQRDLSVRKSSVLKEVNQWMMEVTECAKLHE